MAQFEIYWSDLNADAQERLIDLYHENIDMSPLAIIDVEDGSDDEEWTPPEPEPEIPTSTITVFYRDGYNYKYSEDLTIATSLLDEVRNRLGAAFYDMDEPQVQYDNDLKFTQSYFHDRLGTVYNDACDHNFVMITHINGQPNEKQTT